ncbi:uncharacterized protein LOC131430187 [Malaya genurostris]|uniref:uncharacterized protein LOC131430187 n=1 Tax=Malaya genurostris TaxID=325434 RepID=UPI0026F3A64C|nr:uncharacterized protein LOC131430187 [Malaya genurostris]
MRLSSWLLLVLIGLAQATSEYQCLDFPIEDQCIIEQISYHPGKQITFPAGYRHIRIGFAKKQVDGLHSNVTALDDQLYQAMHRPPILEMENVGMDHLIVPPDLLLGNFARNAFQSVEVNYSKSYTITFLDLDHNRIQNISNISALTNLEKLHLVANAIETIDGTVFAPLIKLKRLYLGSNHLVILPWETLPVTLVYLDCFDNWLENVNLQNVTLPALEYLNIDNNNIQSLNVTELLLATPKLEQVFLHLNLIESKELNKIEQILEKHNIIYMQTDEYYDRYCYNYDGFVEGHCLRRKTQKSVYKAILQSMVCLAVGVLLVGILYWAYKEVRR